MRESLRNDDDMRIIERFFVLQEVTAELRSNSEDREEVGRDADRRDAKRKTKTSDREVCAVESREVFETVIALLPVLEIWIRRCHFVELLGQPRLADINEALRT